MWFYLNQLIKKIIIQSQALSTRKSGELIHEITKNIKSENQKNIFLFIFALNMMKKSDFFFNNLCKILV